MLRNEESCCDLVGAQVLVEQQENLQLACGEPIGDGFWDAAAEPPPFADALQEPAGD